MELKPGYKRTDAGVIPDEWNVRKIGEVSTLINGRGFKPHEWADSGLPIIRIQNLNGSEDFNYFAGTFNPKILVEKGQLLFAWSGSRGTSFGPHVWLGGRAVLNYHTWKVVVNDAVVEQPYFFHAIKRLTAEIEDKAHGASALVHTQKGEMEHYDVLIPPPAEQRAIAGALSDVDALIGALDQLLAKKRDLKQATMQQLLTGHQRLPGFATRWEVKPLGEICSLINGRGFKPHEWAESGLPIIRIQNLNGSEEFNYYAGTYDQKILVEHGQLLFAWSGSRGTSFGPHIWNGGRALLNYHTWKLVVSESRVRPDFFFHALRQLTISIEDQAHGASALVHTQKGEMERLPVSIPPTAEQTAIAEVLSDMDAELAALEQKRDKTRLLKQGMMQELLTGRTRLI